MDEFSSSDSGAHKTPPRSCKCGNETYTIGKNHALKKYDQFALNTSCFWASSPVVQIHIIFVTKIVNKLIYLYYLSKNFTSNAISRNFCVKNSE